ncbi:hypothetical protein B296_00051596 [Ensete ventricosum]|uniref:Uncharacterized protein n=1 Tax=Ensete ventricosum TaxID=4639 RepID=A0A426WY57_ENSVE|nr:hypothetical protein B296_00051596 [Ensete ventricosum]
MMLPLRFLNSGIRAKRRGGQPWPGHLQEWSAMATPPAGMAGHGHAPCRGDRQQGAATNRRSRLRLGGTPFGDDSSLQGRRLRAQRPQELPPEGQRRLYTHRGSSTCRRGGHPLARRPLAMCSTTACATATVAG